jgi:hypothetical protein
VTSRKLHRSSLIYVGHLDGGGYSIFLVVKFRSVSAWWWCNVILGRFVHQFATRLPPLAPDFLHMSMDNLTIMQNVAPLSI